MPAILLMEGREGREEKEGRGGEREGKEGNRRRERWGVKGRCRMAISILTDNTGTSKNLGATWQVCYNT